LIRIHWFLAGALALTAAPRCAPAQTQIPARIDEARTVTLAGNVHPLARPEFLLGAAAEETRLERMVLLLKASSAQQKELDALVEAQQNPRSAAFHQWLTPAEFGARFGASVADQARVRAWLEGHGFAVNEIPAGQRMVVFSGTAGQVEEAFHAGMRRYKIGGALHLANSQDPQIPAALAGAVEGVVSLHDFRRARAGRTERALGPRPQWDMGGNHYLFPADYATIYDLNPVYGAGTTGAGVSIAIAGRSNINLSDVAAFRTASGLAANNPAIILDGADPGLVSGDQDESTLDVEWAGAVAPEAAVKLVTAASTATSDGVDLASAYVVNHALAPVVSVSYGSCEAEMGATELAFYQSLWEQAASQGMSVLVASGDAGAAGCNSGWIETSTEPAVNGLCSSPYSTCVGGTEFDEGGNAGQYWSATNSPSQGSALGYIPEEVWNESGANGGVGLWASGGGASQVYAQPVWQQGVDGTGAANGMRAVPDVAMTAAAHDGTIIYENASYWIVSGTSAAAPSLAGVMALVVEKRGTGQGNANPELYSLLSAPASPFHSTPAGNNSVPGVQGFSAGGAEYNLATGLGSVDGAVLVNEWGNGAALPPTLGLSAAASQVVMVQGGSAQVRVTAATGGSFAGNLTLAVTGLPGNVTAQWSANPLRPEAGANAAVLTLKAGPLARAGTAQVTVTAAGDGLTATAQIAVEVQAERLRVRLFPLPGGPLKMW
jgi:pseudomonalisin